MHINFLLLRYFNLNLKNKKHLLSSTNKTILFYGNSHFNQIITALICQIKQQKLIDNTLKSLNNDRTEKIKFFLLIFVIFYHKKNPKKAMNKFQFCFYLTKVSIAIKDILCLKEAYNRSNLHIQTIS